MNKILIILSIIFVCILIVGFCFAGQTNYTEEEIQNINKSISESAQKANVEQVTNENKSEEKNNIDEAENKSAPEISIMYPDKFNDGDTVETDKVRLSFSDDKGIEKATMNGIPVDTGEILINTEGTYNIAVSDADGNKSTLSFTIKFSEKNTTQNSNVNSNTALNSQKKVSTTNNTAKENKNTIKEPTEQDDDKNSTPDSEESNNEPDKEDDSKNSETDELE